MAEEREPVEAAPEGEAALEVEGVVALDGEVEREDEADGEDGEDEGDGADGPAPEVGPTGVKASRAEVDAAFLKAIERDPAMLLGTMRDHVLKGAERTSFWSELSEREQINYSIEVEHACKLAIRGVFLIAAARNFPAMEMAVVDVTRNSKRVIKAKLEAPYDPNDWRRIGDVAVCTLLPGTSADDYMGALPVTFMPDQPGFFDEGDVLPAEAPDPEAAEREASLARARQFKPREPSPPTLDNDSGDVVADPPPAPLVVAPVEPPVAAPVPSDMSPAERSAWQRGALRAHHSGARSLPGDLVDKELVGDRAEADAWFAGFDSGEVPEADGAAEKPKRGRKRRATAAKPDTDRQASLAGADAPGTYQPA